MPPLIFDIQEPGTPVRRATTSGSVLKIGRNADWVLGLDDTTVGRMHAVIEATDDGKAVIIDLGCEPTTRVNGAPVNKADLRVGDQIQVGQSTLCLIAIGESHVGAALPNPPTPPAFAPAAAEPAPRQDANPWRWEDPAPPERERRPSWSLVVVLILMVLGLGLYVLVR